MPRVSFTFYAAFFSIRCMEHSDFDYQFHADEHFEDVCVTGADRANADSSPAVAQVPFSWEAQGGTNLLILADCLGGLLNLGGY